MPGKKSHSLILAGTVKEMRASRIPRMYIAVIEGEDFSAAMDVHDELRVFGEGDRVTITISQVLPEYREGEDFCAKGFVMSKKPGSDKNRVKLLISLWGFLASLEIPRNRDVFRVMDEVYYCVSKTS